MRNNSIKVTIFSLLGYPLSRKPMMGRSYSLPYVCRESIALGVPRCPQMSVRGADSSLSATASRQRGSNALVWLGLRRSPRGWARVHPLGGRAYPGSHTCACHRCGRGVALGALCSRSLRRAVLAHVVPRADHCSQGRRHSVGVRACPWLLAARL